MKINDRDLLKQYTQFEDDPDLEEEGSITPPKEESAPDQDVVDRAKPAKPKKNRKIICITAGVLAVVGIAVFLCTRFWLTKQEEELALDIDIDEKHFPDENFRNYVAYYDRDENKKLSLEEREKAREIDLHLDNRYLPGLGGSLNDPYAYYVARYNCYLLELQSLEGIEYFPNLEYLNCSGLLLTSLDVSENTKLETLICSNNQLERLDVSANPELDYLDCSGNQLTELDLRSNRMLVILDCRNNRLEKLELGANETLTTLACQMNQLESLDVSTSKGLKTLYCYDNAIEKLNLGKNTKLETVSCRKNALQKLDFSENTGLKWLDCSENEIRELNAKKNTMLELLCCSDNPLTNLQVNDDSVVK